MKTTVLLACALMAAVGARAQVIMNVTNPIALVGYYNVTWATPPTWGVPDPLNPANAVTDTLVFVDDGTASDSLGCGALVNGAAINHQIAVVYRGTCEFGAKALSAQNAGARAVVIINNQPGAPVVPGAGAVGINVTIPVVMISQADGALMRNEIIAGHVVAFIGSIVGLYANDIGFFKKNVYLPTNTARPHEVCQNGTEFNFDLGLWLYNYGTQAQNGVTVTARVSQNGSTVYTQTSAPLNLAGSGDSVFVALGNVALSSYGGYYHVDYSATTAGVSDEFPGNNQYSTAFHVGDEIAFALVDSVTGLTLPTGHVQPANATAGFTMCTHFRDPHASRLGVTGIHFSMAPAIVGTAILGQVVTIDAFRWDDFFTGLSDAPTTPTLTPIAEANYAFTAEVPGQLVFAPFDHAYVLADTMRYLFCVTTYTADWRLGYSESLDYTLTQNTTTNIITTVTNGGTGTFYPGGFIGGGTAAFAVQTVSAASIGIAENDIAAVPKAYPNPTAHLIHIPLPGLKGTAQLLVTDVSGQAVRSEQIIATDGAVAVDVSGMGNGTYVFNLTFKDGGISNFRVVVSK